MAVHIHLTPLVLSTLLILVGLQGFVSHIEQNVIDIGQYHSITICVATPHSLVLAMSSTSLDKYSRAGSLKGYANRPTMSVSVKEKTLVTLLLILSGDCHPNPGPIKHPCGLCDKPVAKNHRAVLCNTCSKWSHIKCSGISLEEYKKLQISNATEKWYCSSCLTKDECPICELHVSDNHRGILCENCDKWYHTRCCGISNKQYKSLQCSSPNVVWICATCELPNFSDSFFQLSPVRLNNSFSVLNDESAEISPDKRSSAYTIGPDCSPLSQSSQANSRFCRNNMKVLIINCRSLRSSSKQAEFQALIHSEDPDIVLATETHLDESFPKKTGLPPGYEAYRTDSHLGAGGALLAFKEHILMSPFDNGDCEAAWGKLLTKGNKPIYIGSFYRNPSSNQDMLTSLEDNLMGMISGNSFPLIILGSDLNLPSINWEDNTVRLNPQYGPGLNQKMLDIVDNFSFTQHVLEPTREGNILDVLLTNYPSCVENVQVIPGMSDHDAVVVGINIGLKTNRKKPRKIYMFRRGNMDAVKQDLREFKQKFQSEFGNRSVEENWTVLRDVIINAANSHIPSKTIRPNKDLPWMTTNIKRQIRRRKRVYNRAKRTGKPEDWQTFRSLRNHIRRELDKAQNTYIQGILNMDNLKSAPKRFWSFVAAKKKDTVGIPPLTTPNGLACSAKRKAETLNAQYSSVFTREDTSSIPAMQTPRIPKMEDIEVDETGVLKLLINLDPYKSCGPDRVPVRIMKECAQEIAPLLTMIFNQSVHTGDLPCDWLSANVCPVYKKGDRSSPNNYRPVSLTSVSCKLLEHIIFHHIIAHVEDHNIIMEYQHGFLKRHSCETQLINTMEEIHRHLDQNRKAQIDVQVLDFSKAFDTVAHERLLHKVEHYGIRDSTLAWIRTWLTNRTQQVVVDGEISDSTLVTSGVPQGTVLGPLMFLLYINDIGDNISSKTKLKLFADDCLLFRPINNPIDQQQLQKDLDSLVAWSHQWQMSFNPQKCHTLHMTRNKNYYKNTYNMMNVNLSDVCNHPYLGVEIATDLSWSLHINQIASKARRTFGFVRRNLSRCDQSVRDMAFKTLIRPQLEYAATVWDPYQSNHINKLEKIQRQAARFVTGDYRRTSSVTEMQHNLLWPTLQQRRKISRLTMFYRSIRHEVAVDVPDYITRVERPQRNRHSQCYIPLQCRTRTYQNSFFPKTIMDWNELPVDTVSQESSSLFKTALVKSSLLLT